MFKINLANKSGGSSVEITVIGFPTICAPLPSSTDASEYPHLDGLELADFDPCSSSSKLGWLLSGWSKQPQSDSSTFSNLILAGERLDNSSVTSDRDDLPTSLKRFWEVESIGIESESRILSVVFDSPERVTRLACPGRIIVLALRMTTNCVEIG